MNELKGHYIIHYTCPACREEFDYSADSSSFIDWPICNIPLYVEGEYAVEHVYYTAQIEELKAEDLLLEKLRKLGFGKEPMVLNSNFYYFPLWYFREANQNIYAKPAAISLFTSIKNFEFGRKLYHPCNKDVMSTEFFTPVDLPIKTIRKWFKKDSQPALLTRLCEVPVYLFEYNYNNTIYLALVEAVSGKVFMDVYPPLHPNRINTPLLLCLILTAIVILLELLFIQGLTAQLVALGITLFGSFILSQSLLVGYL